MSKTADSEGMTDPDDKAVTDAELQEIEDVFIDADVRYDTTICQVIVKNNWRSSNGGVSIFDKHIEELKEMGYETNINVQPCDDGSFILSILLE
jgi:hypothetical protein